MFFALIDFKAGKYRNAAVRVDGNLRGGATERQKISLETGADPQQGRQRTILYRDTFPKISFFILGKFWTMFICTWRAFRLIFLKMLQILIKSQFW